MIHDEKKIEEVIKSVCNEDDGLLIFSKYDHEIVSDILKQYAEHIRKQTIEKTYKEMVQVVHANNLDITPTAMKQLYRDMEHWKNTLSALNDLE